jgi:hypothetical protein
MKLLRLAALGCAAVFVAGAAMAAPATNPDGFNNLPNTHWLYGRNVLTVPAPFRDNQWFDDFVSYRAADWVITTTEAGAGSASEVITDADDGILLLTNDAADDDNDFLQGYSDGTSVVEVFDPESGKEMYFEARFRVSDATQSDFVIGLQVTDTTPLSVADGIYFQKDDGDALLDFHSMSGSVDTASTGIHTMVADTYVKVAFYYDGGSSIVVSVDDTVVSTITATPTGTELAISFGIQNGEAVAKTMSIDYIYVWKER